VAILKPGYTVRGEVPVPLALAGPVYDRELGACASPIHASSATGSPLRSSGSMTIPRISSRRRFSMEAATS